MENILLEQYPMNNLNYENYNYQEEELKRIDDKIGYTYHRHVYGRIYRYDKC